MASGDGGTCANNGDVGMTNADEDFDFNGNECTQAPFVIVNIADVD